MFFFHLKWKWQFSNFNFLLLRQKKNFQLFSPFLTKPETWNESLEIFRDFSTQCPSSPFILCHKIHQVSKHHRKKSFCSSKIQPPSLLNLTWKVLTLKLFNENFFWIKKHFLRKTKKWQSAIQLICLACLFRRGVEPRKGLTRVLKQHD